MENKYSDYKEWKNDKCTIATFNDDQWVGFMNTEARSEISDLYKNHGYYGTVTWLSNYGDEISNSGSNDINLSLDEVIKQLDNHSKDLSDISQIISDNTEISKDQFKNCYNNFLDNLKSIKKH